MELELDDHAAVLPQVLGAVYAAAKLSYRARRHVFRLLRRATRWQGDERRAAPGLPDRRRGRLPAVAHDRPRRALGPAGARLQRPGPSRRGATS